MENNETTIDYFANDDDLGLPVGWDGEGDIFDPASWAPENADSDTVETEVSGEEAPTTELEQPETEEGVIETSAPSKTHIRAKFNHEEIEGDFDADELSTIYQKSLAYDRNQARDKADKEFADEIAQLAQQMGYEDSRAMIRAAAANFRQTQIDKYISEGVHQSVAEALVDFMATKNNAGGSTPAAEPEAEPEVTPEPEAPKRDYQKEIAELLAYKPELVGQQIPEEVVKATEDGTPYLYAYLKYENQRVTAANEQTKKENNIYKQNAASAARAPVKGVSGGGETDTKPTDNFLVGFNSDGW